MQKERFTFTKITRQEVSDEFISGSLKVRLASQNTERESEQQRFTSGSSGKVS